MIALNSNVDISIHNTPPLFRSLAAGTIAAVSLMSVRSSSDDCHFIDRWGLIESRQVFVSTSTYMRYHIGDLDIYYGGGLMDESLLNSLERINEIAGLEDDWNGNGAKSFSPELIDRVKALIYQLNKQPKIFPTAEDSIQLEFENDGDYLEFELFSDGKIREFRYHSDEDNSEQYVSYDSVNKIVGEFYA